MRNFIQHDIPSIKQINSDGGRVYLTPDGKKYPSVTSVTGLHSAAVIAQWRKRVGSEEATKITKKASKRGTAFHTLCENYIKDDHATPSIFDMEMFNSVRPTLDAIDNIHCLENQLYSHHLQVAGTVDCIAEYKGKLCVIDFKSSLKPKKHDWIHGYFMQASAYSFMFWELTGVVVSGIVVVVGVDNHPPQIFEETIPTWLHKFRGLREEYRSQKGL